MRLNLIGCEQNVKKMLNKHETQKACKSSKASKKQVKAGN